MPPWLNVAKSQADAASAVPAIWESRDREATSLETRAKGIATDHAAERLVKEVQAFNSDSAWTFDVLMIIDRSVAGVGLAVGDGFTSGEIDGRAYLYDYRRKAVTCAGRVHAENSDQVRFRYTRRLGDPLGGSGSVEFNHALANDLKIESYRAAAEAVHLGADRPASGRLRDGG